MNEVTYVVVNNITYNVQINGPSITAVVTPLQSQVVSLGIQGPPGPIGPDGGLDSAIAGETISSLRAVVIVNGLLYHADPSNPAHINSVVGIASQSGVTGTIITFQSDGELTGGSYIPGSRYFVSSNGLLSTTVPVAPNWLKQVGIAKNSTTLLVNLGQSVQRS